MPPPSLLLPTLCHPHVHLDKPYILTSNVASPPSPGDQELSSYADLCPHDGTFSEALKHTSQAKTRYTPADLYLRGSQLIAESVQYGVTSMRAFVEVDHVTGLETLRAGVRLKKAFQPICHVQICVFAQDPVMSGEHGGPNKKLMEQALHADEFTGMIEAIGTTPYVESSYADGVRNVMWAVDIAIEKQIHLDFHLDYNLDPEVKPLLSNVVDYLIGASWTERNPNKTVVVGHCTKFATFSESHLKSIRDKILNAKLPIHFVGLPTSDLYMMDRASTSNDIASLTHQTRRATLPIPQLIKAGLDGALSINNVGNTFTPWGNADPLRLASLGVGLYHAGTPADAKLLYACVSTRARRAIGLSRNAEAKDVGDGDFDIHGGQHREYGALAIYNESDVVVQGLPGVIIAARQRLDVKDVVWDPPESRLREIMR